MNRPVRTKLDHQTKAINDKDARDAIINRKDDKYKERIKRNATNRNTQEHNFRIGDHVLLKQGKKNKLSTAYEQTFYIVTCIDGSSIAARKISDQREVY